MFGHSRVAHDLVSGLDGSFMLNNCQLSLFISALPDTSPRAVSRTGRGVLHGAGQGDREMTAGFPAIQWGRGRDFDR